MKQNVYKKVIKRIIFIFRTSLSSLNPIFQTSKNIRTKDVIELMLRKRRESESFFRRKDLYRVFKKKFRTLKANSIHKMERKKILINMEEKINIV